MLIQNRIFSIRKNVDPRLWFYVKSHENPATLLQDLVLLI